MRAAALAFVAALSLNPAVSAARPAPADWSRTVVATPEGGFRMGNPAAPVKLVEYGSLACPHCRHFEETGYKPLIQAYVRTGRVSYEFRNLLITGPDLSISLLAHCAGPARFFPMSEFVFATQPQWEKRFEDMTDAQKAEIDTLTDQQRIVRFAELGGFAPIAARFGLTPAQARQCLSDPKGVERLLESTKSATDNGVSHTPTFLINGTATDAATWDKLEPVLKTALGVRG